MHLRRSSRIQRRKRWAWLWGSLIVVAKAVKAAVTVVREEFNKLYNDPT